MICHAATLPFYLVRPRPNRWGNLRNIRKSSSRPRAAASGTVEIRSSRKLCQARKSSE